MRPAQFPDCHSRLPTVIPASSTVIPAKAGIQLPSRTLETKKLDPRFRGDDSGLWVKGFEQPRGRDAETLCNLEQSLETWRFHTAFKGADLRIAKA